MCSERNDSMLTIVLTSSMLRSAQSCAVKVRYNGCTHPVILIESVLVHLQYPPCICSVRVGGSNCTVIRKLNGQSRTLRVQGS
jgi:hypothetical protein